MITSIPNQEITNHLLLINVIFLFWIEMHLSRGHRAETVRCCKGSKHLLLFLDLSGLSVSELGFLQFNSSQQLAEIMSLLLRQRQSRLRHLQSERQQTHS